MDAELQSDDGQILSLFQRAEEHLKKIKHIIKTRIISEFNRSTTPFLFSELEMPILSYASY